MKLSSKVNTNSCLRPGAKKQPRSIDSDAKQNGGKSPAPQPTQNQYSKKPITQITCNKNHVEYLIERKGKLVIEN